jgi:hypothetical protein
MSESHDLRTARERVQRVFRYLQEMHCVRTPPVVQLDDREWRLKLEDLPESPHIRRGYEPSVESPSSPESDPTGGPFVIKVGRPKETECPEPSVVEDPQRLQRKGGILLRLGRQGRGAGGMVEREESVGKCGAPGH